MPDLVVLLEMQLAILMEAKSVLSSVVVLEMTMDQK